MPLRRAARSGDPYPALRIYAALADVAAWIGSILLALGAIISVLSGHVAGLVAFGAAFVWWLGVKAGADLAQAVLDIADHVGSQ